MKGVPYSKREKRKAIKKQDQLIKKTDLIVGHVLLD
jgi:hypothetical protein